MEDSIFDFDFNIMSEMNELELMYRGKIEPSRTLRDKDKANAELITNYKDQVLRLIMIVRRNAGKNLPKFIRVSDDNIKSAQRRYQRALDKVPNDLSDSIFELWRDYLI